MKNTNTEHPTDSLRWGTQIFTPKPTTPRFVIEKNGPREYAKESRTSNRIYTGMITTWDVVDTHQCEMVSEHRTKRAALLALAHINGEQK